MAGRSSLLVATVAAMAAVTGKVHAAHAKSKRDLPKALFRINCGGGEYTTSGHDVWEADKFFSNGLQTVSNVDGGAGMADQFIYQTARFDKRRQKPDLEYKLPVPDDGLYSVRLHFSDLFKTTSPGERVFTIWVEGERASGGIDPRAMYGWMGGGMVDVSGVVRDGEMNIKFIRHEPGIQAPLVNAIELFQGDVLPQMTTLHAPYPTVQVGTTTTTTATTTTTVTTVTATTTTPPHCAETRRGCCLDGITKKENRRGSNCAESPEYTAPPATVTTTMSSIASDCPPLSRHLYSGGTACLCVGNAVCTGDGCRGLVSLWYFDTVSCPDCMCVRLADHGDLDGGGGRDDEGACADATLPNGGPWHDGDGSTFSCRWFSEAPARCSLIGSIPGASGVSANQACCVCGGGTDGLSHGTIPTTATGSVTAPAECPSKSTPMSGGAGCVCPIGTHCAGLKCRAVLSLGYWIRGECSTCQCIPGLLTTIRTTSTSMTAISTSTSATGPATAPKPALASAPMPAPTTAPTAISWLCNGKVDSPSLCEAGLGYLCKSEIVAIKDRIRSVCPVLCSSCIHTKTTATTSTPTITSTTATATSTTGTQTTETTPTSTSTTTSTSPGNCWGKTDLPHCVELAAQHTNVCSHPTIGLQVQWECPVMCNSCLHEAECSAFKDSVGCNSDFEPFCPLDVPDPYQVRTACPLLCCRVVEALKTTTAVSSAGKCNGKVDPDDCTELREAQKRTICSDPLLGSAIRRRCFVLCNTCDSTTASPPMISSTTSSTVTTTSNPTSTSAPITLPNCNSKVDPPDLCNAALVNFCESAVFYLKQQMRFTCPVLCNSCVTTTAASTTSSTKTTATETTKTATLSKATPTVGPCGLDKDTCSSGLKKHCGKKDTYLGPYVAENCPNMCGCETNAQAAEHGSCTLESNVDFKGYDLWSKKVADPADCAADCLAHHSCTYFTHLGKRCYFKSSGEGRRTLKGAKGGVCTTLGISTSASPSPSTTTVVTTTRGPCNGQLDPLDLCAVPASFCDAADMVVRAKLHTFCPVLCNTCVAPSTTTTHSTSTSTYTSGTCNGVPDNVGCSELSTMDCDERISKMPAFSLIVRGSCLVMCGTCPSGLTPASTSAPTPAPAAATPPEAMRAPIRAPPVGLCNGQADPVGLCDMPSAFCDTPVMAFREELERTCPVLCNACTTTTTHTATTRTQTSTTLSTATATTTTVGTCNGDRDNVGCLELNKNDCDPASTKLPAFSKVVRSMCFVMCGTCPQTTKQTAVQVTLDPEERCLAIPCARLCRDECGWSTSKMKCLFGGATKEKELLMNAHLCPATTKCSGAVDLAACAGIDPLTCFDPLLGDTVLKGCPFMCDVCKKTTATQPAVDDDDDDGLCTGAPDDPICSKVAELCTSVPDLYAVCPRTCGHCTRPRAATTITVTTTRTTPECTADNDAFIQSLSTALGYLPGSSAFIASCREVAPWCLEGSTGRVPDFKWDILIETIRTEACPTTCNSHCTRTFPQNLIDLLRTFFSSYGGG